MRNLVTVVIFEHFKFLCGNVALVSRRFFKQLSSVAVVSGRIYILSSVPKVCVLKSCSWEKMHCLKMQF